MLFKKLLSNFILLFLLINNVLATEIASSMHYFSEAKKATEIDKALLLADKALQLLPQNEELKRVEILRFKFNQSLKIGELTNAVGFCFEALEILKSHQKWKEYLSTLNYLAIAYMKTGEYDEAITKFKMIESFMQEIPLTSPLNKELILGSIYNNLGIIKANHGEFILAQEFYAKAKKYAQLAKDTINLSNIYTNLGKIYEKENDFNLAEGMYLKSLDLRKSINDFYLLAKSYGHLGRFYLNTEKKKLAKENIKHSLEIAINIGADEIEMFCYHDLSLLSELNEDFLLAYKYHVKFKELNDQLAQTNISEQLHLSAQKHEFRKREKILILENQNADYRLAVTLITLGSIILLFLMLWVTIRSKHKHVKLKSQHLSLENKTLNLEKYSLEQMLEFKNKELTTNVMYLMKKNKLINEVSEKLIEIKPSVEKRNQNKVYRIIKELQTATDNDVWKEFELHFSSVHNDFYEVLNRKFPLLTPSEKKLCAFLRLNLTSKEICTITRKTPNSLHVARSRLRKKMGLDNTDVNLQHFLENIE